MSKFLVGGRTVYVYYLNGNNVVPNCVGCPPGPGTNAIIERRYCAESTQEVLELKPCDGKEGRMIRGRRKSPIHNVDAGKTNDDRNSSFIRQ